jgi:hypothetical protein
MIRFKSDLKSDEEVWVDDVVIRTCECVPITYSWWTGDWSECSASCGGGTQTRKVECRDDTSQTVDDTFCSDSAPEPGPNRSPRILDNSSTSRVDTWTDVLLQL